MIVNLYFCVTLLPLNLRCEKVSLLVSSILSTWVHVTQQAVWGDTEETGGFFGDISLCYYSSPLHFISLQ